MFDPVFSKVLVAYDGSEPSKRALDHGAKMAAMFEGELAILTVVPRVSIPVYSNAELGAQAMDIASLQECGHYLMTEYISILGMVFVILRPRNPFTSLFRCRIINDKANIFTMKEMSDFPHIFAYEFIICPCTRS